VETTKIGHSKAGLDGTGQEFGGGLDGTGQELGHCKAGLDVKVTHHGYMGHVIVIYPHSSILGVVTRTVELQGFVLESNVHVFPLELCGPTVWVGEGSNVKLVLLINVVLMLAVMLLQISVYVTGGTTQTVGAVGLVALVTMESVQEGSQQQQRRFAFLRRVFLDQLDLQLITHAR